MRALTEISGKPEVKLALEKTRLEVLEETLGADPENAFARYGLAMELQNAGRLDEAWEHFDHLLKQQPEYSATYFQAGTLLARLRRNEEAMNVLTRGIEVTARQGKRHARDELQAALDELRNSEF